MNIHLTVILWVTITGIIQLYTIFQQIKRRIIGIVFILYRTIKTSAVRVQIRDLIIVILARCDPVIGEFSHRKALTGIACVDTIFQSRYKYLVD